MHQRHHGEHHALVPLGEVGEKFLGFAPKLFQVIGDRGGEVSLSYQSFRADRLMRSSSIPYSSLASVETCLNFGFVINWRGILK